MVLDLLVARVTTYLHVSRVTAYLHVSRVTTYLRVSRVTAYLLVARVTASLLLEGMSDCCLTHNRHFSDISWREQVTFNEIMTSQPMFTLTL
jgi:hypothetical protein